jgi:phosphatidylglycerol:prolipoprotein diacylglycerol transferase
MPKWSLPVHPSQIYAAINAALLALLIWHLQPLPKRDGVAFVVAIGCYAVSRFVLEWVRSDEAGQLGTSFTISQWIAMASGLIAVLAIVSLQRMPAKRAWSW